MKESEEEYRTLVESATTGVLQVDTAGHTAYANPAITTRGRGHAPTGSTKAGVNGLFEMGANAWEWTDGGTDSARPTRGGSWWYGAAQMHRDHVQTKPPDTAVVYIGFRCAKSLPSLELK